MGDADRRRLGWRAQASTGLLAGPELMSSSPFFGVNFGCLARACNESIGSRLIRMPRA